MTFKVSRTKSPKQLQAPKGPQNSQSTHHTQKKGPQGFKMFIGGFAPLTTSEELNHYFSVFGAIREVQVMGENTKHPKGYGFVIFAEEDSYTQALKGRHYIGGKEVDTNHAIERDSVEQGAHP